MDRRHILIGGQRGVGKSTLVARLLEAYTRPVYGFVTRMTASDERGFHQIYIHPAGASRQIQTTDNLIGDCDTRIHNVNSLVFETLGTEYLRHKDDGIILMDELGFMEADSPAFCADVLSCLDGDVPVLATVKARFDVPFLDQVRGHPNAAFYEITQENREALYETLLPIILGWNEAAGQ